MINRKRRTKVQHDIVKIFSDDMFQEEMAIVKPTHLTDNFVVKSVMDKNLLVLGKPCGMKN